MKKLFAILLALALLLPVGAWACDEPAVLSVKCCGSIVYEGASWWAVTEDHSLAGIKDYGQMVEHFSVTSTKCQWIAGWMENGWAMQAGAVRTVTVDGQTAGLTCLHNVSFTIYAECVEILESMIHAYLGDDVEISANAIAALMLWWDGDYASEIFFPSYSDRFVIGAVHFNGGADVVALCMGHFGEQLRVGLPCGYREPEPVREWIDVNITAEAAANAEAVAAAQVSAQAAAVSLSNSGSVDQSGDGCYRNNTVIQINLGIVQTVKNCIRLLKECAE